MISNDYAERVYAGVLGKMTGVYLGRPFEGWSYDRIQAELGDIRYYVNDHPTANLRHRRLIVTDDDLSGTFVFARALADNGFTRTLTSRQIGETWLNYIVEGHTILWWGGIGTSTEHTVYTRLRDGIPAPRSGSIETNGRTLAEQIGAQIFIDGWALANPGEPERAAYFARQAARVSHDGIAVEAAVLIAAMEAMAFECRNMGELLDGGLKFVNRDSGLRPLIATIRDWHARDGDWRKTRARIADVYGYDKYPGICHVVPNHALVIMSLLYGDLDLSRSLEIVCTSGWDTDCNAGNVGCLVGIAKGLDAFSTGPDWRGPVADRIFLTSAEGGRTISDAVAVTREIVRAGHALAGLPLPVGAKDRRFDFAFPGSVQGFAVAAGAASAATVAIENVPGHSRDGERSLAIHFAQLDERPVSVATRTFALPEEFDMRSYDLVCCPTLYAGQTVELRVEADAGNGETVRVSACCRVFGENDETEMAVSDAVALEPGERRVLRWTVPDTGGNPILDVGLLLQSQSATPARGTIYLDDVRWDGAPDTILRRPDTNGTMWQRAWAVAATSFDGNREAFRITQDTGIGMAIQGTREWRDYAVSCSLVPNLADRWGLAARVQGLRRYYAVVFDARPNAAGLGGTRVRLVRMLETEETLCELEMPWQPDRAYHIELKVEGRRIEARIDRVLELAADDSSENALDGGAIAMLVSKGSLATQAIAIQHIG